MAARTIPQRELRNNIAEILREAETGTEFTITVRGRPVAKLGPAVENDQRRVDVPATALRARLAQPLSMTASRPTFAGFASSEDPQPIPGPAIDPSAARYIGGNRLGGSAAARG